MAFAGQNLAETALVTALAIQAFRQSGAFALGMVGFRFLPAAVFGLLLGPAFDHLLGRHILARVATARTILLALCAVCVMAGAPLAFVLVIVAIDAIMSGPYRPAQARLLPSLARTPVELSAAAAGISVVKSISQAVGGLAGGLLVAVAKPGSVMALAAIVMGVATVVNYGIHEDGVGRRSSLDGTHHESGRAALKAGVAAVPRVLRHRDAWPLVSLSGLRTLVRGMWTVLAVATALHLLSLGASGVGLLQLAVGVGAFLAVPLTVSLIGREHLSGPCILAFLGAGLPLVALDVFDARPVALVAMIVWGTAMALSDSTSMSLFHRLLDGASTADTVSVTEVFKGAAEGVGCVLAAVLLASFGVRPALVVAGLVLPVVMLVLSRHVRRADLNARGRAKTVTLLHGVKELKPLDMASLEQVSAGVRRWEVAAGQTVIQEGEPGYELYVIESGSADVIVGGYVVGHLGPGSRFGERALLRNTVRAATVKATEPLSLLVVDQADFLGAVTGQAVATGIAESHEFIDLVRLSHAPRSPREAIAHLAVFTGSDDTTLDSLAAAAITEEWSDGCAIIEEGALGDSLYVILTGRATVHIHGNLVGELLAGDSFGEIAVLHDVPRRATVTADGPLTTCRLDRSDVLAARTSRGSVLS